MHQELTEEQINSILHGIAIPPQPQIMVDLQMEQLNPNTSIQQISKLISQDVGLSGSILKTVNSPFFSHCNHITSITQAVSLLGINSVVNLVNAQSIKGALSDDDIIAMNRFWDNALDIAMASAVIAKQIGFPNSDEAYSLGLFHNAGVPLLMSRFSEYQQVQALAYASCDKSITDIENDELQTNHAVVGYYVAKSWKLPMYLCEAIHEHHQPQKTLSNPNSDPKKATLLAILKMAEHICRSYKVLGQQDNDHEWAKIGTLICAYAGLSEYDFVNLEQHIHDIGISNQDFYTD